MRRPRPALVWAAIVGGSLLAAAVVAPLAYALLQTLGLETGQPFSRFFNRTAMVAATVAILVLRREIGWCVLMETVRQERRGMWLRRGTAGFVAALLGAAAGVAWALADGRLVLFAEEFEFSALRAATTLVGALVAAVLEEAFFRGLMLPTLASRSSWPLALVASSALYSLVHLLVSDRSFVWPGYAPRVGFDYFGGVLARQLEPASIAPLFGLFLVGLVLGSLFRRTSSLALVIGLHAGWAAAFPLLRLTTSPLEPIPGTSYLATHHFLIGRSWAFAAIGVSGVLAFLWATRTARRRAPCATVDSI